VVPPLLLENEGDARRFLEAMKRKELKEAYRDAFDSAKSVMHVSKNIRKLSEQRCVIGWETKDLLK
jgi:predicted transcriptional regulator